MIECQHSQIPVSRQCALAGLPRSSFYYQKRPESELNLTLMNLIDEQYTKAPFYGVPRMTAWLKRRGYVVNHKRVARLMRAMGLEAIHPKRRTSIPNKEHKVYPYLLRGIRVEWPDQVWAADLTYIRMLHGFVYLVAIMDWYSRYVLAWELSISMEKQFCLDALDSALDRSRPMILNTDQGSQFTSSDFTARLESCGIAVSMDGRGRVFDNIFIERLWRTVKYEEVYLHSYETVTEARSSLSRYFDFYNTERLHSSLGNLTPYEVYFKEQRGSHHPVDSRRLPPYTECHFV
jgi:putative transposase